MDVLTIPEAARRDDNAVQMLSAWVAENGLHCSINIGKWEAMGHDEVQAWGILLADAVRHIGNALEEKSGVPSDTVVARIAAALDAELNDPTSAAHGGFQPGLN
jgi:hypothetical protein